MLRPALLLLVLPCVSLAQQTVAEKTDYKSSSGYADVVAFGEELATKSGSIRLAEVGRSGEARRLPLWVISDPPVSTPEEAARGGKLVTLIVANVQAGGVDGPEAVSLLALHLATGAAKPFLKDLVVLIVPVLNADGNEKVDDFVKLETPEVRGLAKVVARWDPAVVVELRTTNSTGHRYTLTYDSPRIAAADPELVAIVRDRWLPDITSAMEKETGYKSFVRGNFNADRTAWESHSPMPRDLVQWVALRNRVGLIAESHSHVPLKDRVLASRSFASNVLKYLAAHPANVRTVIGKADKPRERIALRDRAAVARRPYGARVRRADEGAEGLQGLAPDRRRGDRGRPASPRLPDTDDVHGRDRDAPEARDRGRGAARGRRARPASLPVEKVTKQAPRGDSRGEVCATRRGGSPPARRSSAPTSRSARWPRTCSSRGPRTG